MTLKQKEKNSQNQQARDYSKFLGLVFQVAAVIGIFTFIGVKLDENFNSNSEQPWFTISMALVGLTIGMYLMIRESFRK